MRTLADPDGHPQTPTPNRRAQPPARTWRGRKVNPYHPLGKGAVSHSESPAQPCAVQAPPQHSPLSQGETHRPGQGPERTPVPGRWPHEARRRHSPRERWPVGPPPRLGPAFTPLIGQERERLVCRWQGRQSSGARTGGQDATGTGSVRNRNSEPPPPLAGRRPGRHTHTPTPLPLCGATPRRPAAVDPVTPPDPPPPTGTRSAPHAPEHPQPRRHHQAVRTMNADEPIEEDAPVRLPDNAVRAFLHVMTGRARR